uniref:hypothetical protein n=1 Tax=Paractinoplanes polyasparticus TaxID=2856853 RepID=UPI001C855E02|nr:hypothetical protein [Actinoplanes polyasparticus]
MTGDLESLRAEIARLRGPARTESLLRLAQGLGDRYHRAGPGLAAARPYLDEAIDVLAEAYAHFDPADAWRGQVAAILGQQYGLRHLAHFGADQDRMRAVPLLDEGLAFEHLPAALRLPGWVTLGQLHMSPVIRRLRNPLAMLRGLPHSVAADLDRAEECYRQALAAPQLGAEGTRGARSLLEIVGVLRECVGGVHPGALVKIFQRLRELQAGVSPVVVLGDGEPADRPVAVVDVPSTRRAPARPGFRPARSPAPDVSARRQALRALLPSGDQMVAARALLHETPDRTRTDRLVALAVGVAALDPDDGGNQLLLAVALWHRARAGSGGWPGCDDLGAAGATLRAATRLLRPLSPQAQAVAGELTAALDQARRTGPGTAGRTEPRRTHGPRTP